ncbi:MAG: hypothetical protein AAGG48_16425 [Planctomycetota bacterium]
MNKRQRLFGFTAMELLLTLTVLSAVAMLAVPAFVRQQAKAATQITIDSLSQLRTVINNDFMDDMHESLPYPMDPSRQTHPQLRYLYDNPAAYAAANPDALESTSAWSYDPTTGRGWSGPYVDHRAGIRARYVIDDLRGFVQQYGEEGDPVPLDGWGNPIVLQQPVGSNGVHAPNSTRFARLVSAGPDGILQTPIFTLEPTPADTADDLVVYLESR